MKLYVFSVKDHKACAFGRPFMTTHAGVAIRSFADQVNSSPEQGDMLSKFPEDFSLYELGSWDDSDASYDLLAQPKHLVDAAGVLNLRSDRELPVKAVK